LRAICASETCKADKTNYEKLPDHSNSD